MLVSTSQPNVAVLMSPIEISLLCMIIPSYWLADKRKKWEFLRKTRAHEFCFFFL